MRISSKLFCTGALIVLGTAAHADAQTSGKIRACITNNGSVKILAANENCSPRDTAIDWNVSGPAGPQGPQGPEGPPGSGGGGLRVKNAVGEDIGPLLDPSTVVLTLPSGRKTYAQLFVTPPSGANIVQYYTTADCSGDAYVVWNSLEELLPPALVRLSGVWATKPGTIATRTIRSSRAHGDSGPSPTCSPMNTPLTTTSFDFYTPAELRLTYPLQVE